MCHYEMHLRQRWYARCLLSMKWQIMKCFRFLLSEFCKRAANIFWNTSLRDWNKSKSEMFLVVYSNVMKDLEITLLKHNNNLYHECLSVLLLSVVKILVSFHQMTSQWLVITHQQLINGHLIISRDNVALWKDYLVLLCQ